MERPILQLKIIGSQISNLKMILGIAHSHLRYDQVYVGGVKIAEDQNNNDNTRTTTTFVVPNGATYKIIYNDSILWAELR